MPNVREPSRGHSSAAGPKPDREQWAVHRRPEAEQHRKRLADPSSSLASHNANRDASPTHDDTTTPTLASGSSSSRKTRQLQSHKLRPARGNVLSAWQQLLPDLAARRAHAARRTGIARTTSAPGQGGNQTDTACSLEESARAAIRVVVAPARRPRRVDAAAQQQCNADQQRCHD